MSMLPTAKPSALPSNPKAVVAPETLQRVLLVKLSSLGDIAHALPLAQAIKTALPTLFLGWAVKSRFAKLLHGNPYLNAVYELEGSGVREIARLGRTLRAESFDTALDIQGLLVSGLVTRLSAAPRRIGFDNNREGNALFLTHAVVPGKQRAHMVERLAGFCAALDIPYLPPQPQRYLAEAGADVAHDLLNGGHDRSRNSSPIVGCIVGASTPEKAWHPQHWAELAHLLAARDMRVVLLGGGGEAAAAAEIVRRADSAVFLNLAGKTPLQILGAVLAQCDVVVGGDSGPTHLAVAVGTPVVGLYGVTDPVRTGVGWGYAPGIELDYATDVAPPETRRARHTTVQDALGRIPAAKVAAAVVNLFENRVNQTTCVDNPDNFE